MFNKAYILVRFLLIMWLRKDGKFDAPAEPASSTVVTPFDKLLTSGSIP